MRPLAEYAVSCPYCGEQLEVLLDPSEEEQDYIEDCQVCCRPIVFLVQIDPVTAAFSVQVRSENE